MEHFGANVNNAVHHHWFSEGYSEKTDLRLITIFCHTFGEECEPAKPPPNFLVVDISIFAVSCRQKCLAGAWKQLRWNSDCGQGPEDCSRRVARKRRWNGTFLDHMQRRIYVACSCVAELVHNLNICRLSRRTCGAMGGDEIVLLCDKIKKGKTRPCWVGHGLNPSMDWIGLDWVGWLTPCFRLVSGAPTPSPDSHDATSSSPFSLLLSLLLSPFLTGARVCPREKNWNWN